MPAWIDGLLDELVRQPINRDVRTTSNPGTYLGWSPAEIFSKVIGGGQADFDASLGNLQPADRARLYGLYNMRRHLDELSDAFSQLFDSANSVGTPTVIDFGCGPFTAGLALAARLDGQRPFRYYGVDRAASMRDLGKGFADGARRCGVLHARTTVEFSDDLAKLDFGRISGDLTIVVASYLLHSDTLDVDALVEALDQSFQRIGPGPVAVLYTNSGKDWPNRKYPAFRSNLEAIGFVEVVCATERFTKTRTPADLRYALLKRDANLDIPLGAP